MNDYVASKQEPANNTEDTNERRAKEIKEQEKSSANKFVVSSEQDATNADVTDNVESTGEIVKVIVLAKDAKDIHHSRTDDQKDQPTNPDKVQQITNEKGMERTRKEKPNSETNNVEEPSNKENDAESVKTDVSHTCEQPPIGSSKDNIEKKSNGEEGTANKKDDISPPHKAGSKGDLTTHDADRESENHSTDNDDRQVTIV